MTQIDFEHYKVKSPYMCIVTLPGLKFYTVSLCDQPFSRHRPFWDKCTEWPQIDLEPYIKINLHMHNSPDSQI